MQHSNASVTLLRLYVVLLVAASVAQGSTKRGLADPIGCQCEDLAATPNAASAYSFTYNWGPTPPNCSLGRELFVPMLWGRGTVTNRAEWSNVPQNSAYLLALNEPNHVGQSNLTPAEAAALWPQVEVIAEKKNVSMLSGPVVAPCTSGPPACVSDTVPWLDQFIGNCTDCRFDFLVVHFYACHPFELITFLDSLTKYNKTIWLNEFNCGGGSSGVPVPVQMQWMNESISILEARPEITHYSWMAGQDLHNTVASLYAAEGNGSSRVLPLGKLYLSF
jgi:hypothetical protein